MPRRRELGRGERVIPGLWRLRLPLPLPGVPHCNAWAIACGDGVVLVDTGMHEPGSMVELERAFAQVGLRVEDVKLLVCTHAHIDHWGQAATICDRAGCELWMHPNHEHGVQTVTDPDVALARRLEIARQGGVPESALARLAERVKDMPSGIARAIEPDRALVDGVTVESDLGAWRVYETPGHAPSHVCLFQAERRVLISGDHVLGRISLYFDYDWTPDPIGEFLASLDVVDALDARLALSGHGRPFIDVRGHIEGNRRLVAERLDAVLGAVADAPRTAAEIAPVVHGEPLTETNGRWVLQETLCYLTHLELRGLVRREVALVDTAPGDGALGDGALGEGTLGGGALGDSAVGEGTLGGGALGDGALGEGTLGGGALGDSAVGGGALGSGAEQWTLALSSSRTKP